MGKSAGVSPSYPALFPMDIFVVAFIALALGLCSPDWWPCASAGDPVVSDESGIGLAEEEAAAPPAPAPTGPSPEAAAPPAKGLVWGSLSFGFVTPLSLLLGGMMEVLFH